MLALSLNSYNFGVTTNLDIGSLFPRKMSGVTNERHAIEYTCIYMYGNIFELNRDLVSNQSSLQISQQSLEGFGDYGH